MAKLNAIRHDTYTVAVLDMHRGLHETTQNTLEQVGQWLTHQDPATGMLITEQEWQRVKELVQLHGGVHIATNYDADILIIKGGTNRG